MTRLKIQEILNLSYIQNRFNTCWATIKTTNKTLC